MEYQPPEDNHVITLADEAILEDIEAKIDVDDPLEFIMFNNPIMERKCLMTSTRNDFLQNRISVLKLLDRNMFRLEVALFLKLLIRNKDYTHFMSYYGQGKHHLKKILEGESCLPQTNESPNPQLQLML